MREFIARILVRLLDLVMPPARQGRHALGASTPDGSTSPGTETTETTPQAAGRAERPIRTPSDEHEPPYGPLVRDYALTPDELAARRAARIEARRRAELAEAVRTPARDWTVTLPRATPAMAV